MASSNNSKTEMKKTKNAKETSKTKKKKNDNKNNNDNNNNNKKKKLNLSNHKSKHNDDESLVVPSSSTESQKEERVEEENDTVVVTNGRTSAAKPKKSRRKREEDEDNDVGEAKTHAFPMNRIKTMIKGEDPELRVSQEAIFAINKAAEKFLEQFTQDAYARSAQERKKSLSYMNLAYVVSKQRRYDFLSDFVPEKLKAEDALRERNSGGNGGSSLM